MGVPRTRGIWHFAHPFLLLLILEQFEKKGGPRCYFHNPTKLSSLNRHQKSSASTHGFFTFPPPGLFSGFNNHQAPKKFKKTPVFFSDPQVWGPIGKHHSQDSMSQTLIHAGDLDKDDSSGPSWIFGITTPRHRVVMFLLPEVQQVSHENIVVQLFESKNSSSVSSFLLLFTTHLPRKTSSLIGGLIISPCCTPYLDQQKNPPSIYIKDTSPYQTHILIESTDPFNTKQLEFRTLGPIVLEKWYQ